MNFEVIKQIVINNIEKISSIKIKDCDVNLFGSEYGLDAVVMMYIIDGIERELGQSICNIFKTQDASIMTVNNLAMQILQNV